IAKSISAGDAEFYNCRQALTNVELSSSILVNALAANVLPREKGIHVQDVRSVMNREFQIRFLAGFLVLLTIAAVTLAWINFRKESQFVPPYDGVWWVEHDRLVVADRIDTDGPGARAGIRLGDILLAVDGRSVSRIVDLNYQLYRDGTWSKSTYTVMR